MTVIHNCDSSQGWSYEKGTLTVDTEFKAEGAGSIRFEGSAGYNITGIGLPGRRDFSVENVFKFRVATNFLYGDPSVPYGDPFIVLRSSLGNKVYYLRKRGLLGNQQFATISIDVLSDEQDILEGSGFDPANVTTIDFYYIWDYAAGRKFWIDMLEKYEAAPQPEHALTIQSTPISGIPFTINAQPVITPFSQQLAEGTYSIELPPTVQAGTDFYNFSHWEDGLTQPTRTVNLTSDMAFTAVYELSSAPPEMYDRCENLEDDTRYWYGENPLLTLSIVTSPKSPLGTGSIKCAQAAGTGETPYHAFAVASFGRATPAFQDFTVRRPKSVFVQCEQPLRVSVVLWDSTWTHYVIGGYDTLIPANTMTEIPLDYAIAADLTRVFEIAVVAEVKGSAATFYIAGITATSEPLPEIPLSASISPSVAVTVYSGSTVTFSAKGRGGKYPYTYQWYFDGELIVGQTNANFEYSAIAIGEHTVFCRVTDSAGISVDTPTVPITVIQAPTVKPPIALHTEGRKIFDANRQQVTLRGVCFNNFTDSCVGWFPGGSYTNWDEPAVRRTLEGIAKWGGNVIACYQIYEWLDNNSRTSEGGNETNMGVIDALKEFITIAYEYGIYVGIGILDIASLATGWEGGRSNLQWVVDHKAEWIAFWVKMSRTFRIYPNVFFMSIGEPYPNDAALLEGYYQACAEALEAMRADGDEHIVMYHEGYCESPVYNFSHKLHEHGINVVYDTHIYRWHGTFGTSPEAPYDYNGSSSNCDGLWRYEDVRDTLMRIHGYRIILEDWNVPLFMWEGGANNTVSSPNTRQKELDCWRNVFKVLNEEGIGYAGFWWRGGVWALWTDAATFTPTEWGQVLIDAIAYAPPPAGKGLLEIHAFLNNQEIVVPYEIVEITVTGNTPQIVEVIPGIYTVKATLGTETKTETAQVLESQTVRVDFHFEVLPTPPIAIVPVVSATAGLILTGIAIS